MLARQLFPLSPRHCCLGPAASHLVSSSSPLVPLPPHILCPLCQTGVQKAAALCACVEGAVTHLFPSSILQMHAHVYVVCDDAATLDLKVSVERRDLSLELTGVAPLPSSSLLLAPALLLTPFRMLRDSSSPSSRAILAETSPTSPGSFPGSQEDSTQTLREPSRATRVVTRVWRGWCRCGRSNTSRARAQFRCDTAFP